MRKEKVIEIIGKENWEDFQKWMCHQTVGIYPDGGIDYYENDVRAFETKLKTGYDRQGDFRAFD